MSAAVYNLLCSLGIAGTNVSTFSSIVPYDNLNGKEKKYFKRMMTAQDILYNNPQLSTEKKNLLSNLIIQYKLYIAYNKNLKKESNVMLKKVKALEKKVRKSK